MKLTLSAAVRPPGFAVDELDVVAEEAVVVLAWPDCGADAAMLGLDWNGTKASATNPARITRRACRRVHTWPKGFTTQIKPRSMMTNAPSAARPINTSMARTPH